MPSEVLHCLTMWHGSSEALLFLPAWHFGTPVDGIWQTAKTVETV